MKTTACRPFALLLFSTLLAAVPLRAQEASLKPGINKSYVDPDLARQIKSLESPGRSVVRMSEAIVAACQLECGMRAADVGAGTGLFVRLMASKVGAQGKVYAVDISQKFVDHIAKTCREAGLNHVEAVRCSETSANLPPRSVDLVFICDTYHHFEYPFKSLASIAQALRPGGRLVIVDYEKDEKTSAKWVLGHVRADRATVIKEAAGAGFKLVDEQRLTQDQYMLRFVRK